MVIKIFSFTFVLKHSIHYYRERQYLPPMHYVTRCTFDDLFRIKEPLHKYYVLYDVTLHCKPSCSRSLTFFLPSVWVPQKKSLSTAVISSILHLPYNFFIFPLCRVHPGQMVQQVSPVRMVILVIQEMTEVRDLREILYVHNPFLL